MNKINFQLLIIIVIIIFSLNIVNAQQNPAGKTQLTADTLTLDEIIKSVIANHPSVKESEEVIGETSARINLAKTGRYPNIDIMANYTRIGPVSDFDIPGLGDFKLFPENNYNASLNISENIFDFGKTERNVEYETENKILLKQKLEQVKQTLSVSAINAYFSILYLQEALEIKDEQLKDLNEHLDFVRKKQETGSGIQYEILSTQVRISNVESQKTDMEASLTIQRSALNSLLGEAPYSVHYVKNDLAGKMISVKEDSLFSYATEHREEMNIAREKTRLAELHYNVTKSQNYPVINIFASGGWKNGYIPDLNALTANFAAGIGLTLPIFDAGRNKNNILLANATITEDNFETEVVKRKIESEVVENNENLKASQKKLDQFKLQLEQAEKAYSLAEINFREGAITNLDLLDAATNVSESRLLLLKANIDYAVNTYKMETVLGDKLY